MKIKIPPDKTERLSEELLRSLGEYYPLRFIMDVGDFFGSLFIYQFNPPKVRQYIKDIPYANDDGKQMLDIVIPRGKGPFPVMVYIHGGGWLGGDKCHYARICRQFAEAGTLVFNINYRLVPEYRFPIQLQDTASAVAWAYENAAKYGGDPDKIFITGDSAGAHLASWYGAALNSPDLQKAAGISNMLPVEKIRGLLLFFGVYDMEAACHLGFNGLKPAIEGFIGLDSLNYKEIAHIASPIRHINALYPPVFLTCGEADRLFPQSVDFEKELIKNNVPHDSFLFPKKEYPDGKHAFLYKYFTKSAKTAMAGAREFIKKYGGDKE